MRTFEERTFKEIANRLTIREREALNWPQYSSEVGTTTKLARVLGRSCSPLLTGLPLLARLNYWRLIWSKKVTLPVDRSPHKVRQSEHYAESQLAGCCEPESFKQLKDNLKRFYRRSCLIKKFDDLSAHNSRSSKIPKDRQRARPIKARDSQRSLPSFFDRENKDEMPPPGFLSTNYQSGKHFDCIVSFKITNREAFFVIIRRARKQEAI